MKIYASKQVGPIYYMVDSVAILRTISTTELIKTSNEAEEGYSDNKSHHYVSFLRSVDKAGRNPKRWRYGVELDGTKLSNRYKIVPYSFSGNKLQGNKRYFRIKYAAEYDDDTFVLQLVDWPVMKIPEKIFREIESAILSDCENINEIKKLQITPGVRAYRGRKAIVKYTYPVPSGGNCYK